MVTENRRNQLSQEEGGGSVEGGREAPAVAEGEDVRIEEVTDDVADTLEEVEPIHTQEPREEVLALVCIRSCRYGTVRDRLNSNHRDGPSELSTYSDGPYDFNSKLRWSLRI